MRGKILVVEDDTAIAEIIELLLVEAGYHVQLAGTVKEFTRHFYNYHADLIILDIRLPDGDGRDLCRAVKYDYTSRNIPVVLMSAHVFENESGAMNYADAFISKPFDIDQFLATVNPLLPQ